MKTISIQPIRWNAEEINAQVKECGGLLRYEVNHIAFMMSLEPESLENPLEKARSLTAQFRKSVPY